MDDNLQIPQKQALKSFLNRNFETKPRKPLPISSQNKEG